ncbi:histidine kinase [Streptomyces albus subsp. albus]|nr:histidine kinase [Streptomyces albus subsp. albus]
MWPARRIVGESLSSFVLGLLAVGLEALDGAGTPRIVAVALAAALLSPLRRALPASVLLVAAVGSVEFFGLAPLVSVAGWSAGRRIAGARRAVGVFTLAYVLNFSLTTLWEWPIPPLGFVFGALLTLVTMVLPGLISRYRSQRRTLLDTLQEYNAQLLREREMVAGQARMRERQRIAQDMHDSLGHQLALISVHTGALEVDSTLSEPQRGVVGVLRKASATAMHELRAVVGLLRDGTEVPEPAADAVTPSRGLAGLDSLAEASRGAGTAVELRRSGEPRPLTPAADHAAYRVAQEGLTNAHKHAPNAPITIGLRYEPDALVLEVVNGPPPAAPGRPVVSGRQGLTGLGERTRLAGGMVHAGPTADGGFRLAAVLPYAPADRHAAASGATVATFVDPQDDLRRQSPGGSLGEGGQVTDWNGLPKELAQAMSKSKSSTGKGIAIGCGLAALIVLLLIGALAAVLYWAFREADDAMIDPKTYDSVKVGQSEAQVRKQLPDGNSLLTDGLDKGKGAPPKPQGATCLTLLSTEPSSHWDKDPVFRFCFKDGTLIEKKSFEVKQ